MQHVYNIEQVKNEMDGYTRPMPKAELETPKIMKEKEKNIWKQRCQEITTNRRKVRKHP